MSQSRIQKIVPHLWYAKEAAEEMLKQVKLDIAKLEAAFEGR